ncbi:MAG: acyltransferase family protein [Gemmatimonadaceae bacterium]
MRHTSARASFNTFHGAVSSTCSTPSVASTATFRPVRFAAIRSPAYYMTPIRRSENVPVSTPALTDNLAETSAVEDRPAHSVIDRARIPALDSLRGVAVLMVLFNHGFYWGRNYDGGGLGGVLVRASHAGWLGVNLFFVLSGFLITRILIETRDSPRFYRSFYSRRALRILPAYLGLLLILLVVGAIQAGFAALCIFFLANIAPILGMAMQYRPLWSLAVEEHYYLVWPSIVRRLSLRQLAAIVICVAIATPIVRWIAFRNGIIQGLSIYTWFNLDGLALGSLLAIIFVSTQGSRRTLVTFSIATIVLGVGILMVGRPYGIMRGDFPLGAALQIFPWCLAFAGLMAWLLTLDSPRANRWTDNSILVFFGDISYGLYLIHWLVFTEFDRVASWAWNVNESAVPGMGYAFLRLLIAGGIAVGIAWVSRRKFEQRYMRLKNRVAPRPQHSIFT